MCAADRQLKKGIFRDASAVIGFRNNGKDAPAGDKGGLPPVVDRASSWYAVHGRNGSGTARWREEFWLR